MDFHKEITTEELTIPEDTFISKPAFKQFMVYKRLTPLIREKTKRKESMEAKALSYYETSNPSFYYVYEVLGDYYASQQQIGKATAYWQKALTMPIPKDAEKARIQQKIKKHQ